MVDHNPINTNTPGGSCSFTLEAIPEKFAIAQERVHDFLDPLQCSMRTLLDLDMVVEEVFINIANYAYSQDTGTVTMDLSLSKDKNTLYLTFRDKGIPYDPLRKESPDLSAPAEKRPIGGLGIFLVQKLSDSLSYEYADEENRLTVGKKLK